MIRFQKLSRMIRSNYDMDTEADRIKREIEDLKDLGVEKIGDQIKIMNRSKKENKCDSFYRFMLLYSIKTKVASF